MANKHDDDDFVITKEDIETSPFDSAEYLDSSTAMQEYLNVTFEEEGNDLKAVGSSLGRLFRAWALTKLVNETKIKRSELSQILLGAGNPTPEALTKIAEALGLEVPDHFGKSLHLQPRDHVVSQTHYKNRQVEQLHATR